jgi:hypothetical protein
MQMLIMTESQLSSTIINGKRHLMRKYLCVRMSGIFSEIGVMIGCINTQTSQLVLKFDCYKSSNLIQSWRLMRILDHVKCLDVEILEESWLLVGRTEIVMAELHNLIRALGGVDRVQALRQEIWQLAPSAEELELMLTALIVRQIEVNVPELQLEIEMGAIQSSLLIEALIAEEEKINQALIADDENLGLFLKYLRCSDFLILNDGVLSRMNLSYLDRIVRLVTTDARRLAEYTLLTSECVSFDFVRHDISEMRPMYPQFLAEGETVYTLLAVKFVEGVFLVRTMVSPKHGDQFEDYYTVSALKKLVKNVPANLLTILSSVQSANN